MAAGAGLEMDFWWERQLNFGTADPTKLQNSTAECFGLCLCVEGRGQPVSLSSSLDITGCSNCCLFSSVSAQHCTIPCTTIITQTYTTTAATSFWHHQLICCAGQSLCCSSSQPHSTLPNEPTRTIPLRGPGLWCVSHTQSARRTQHATEQQIAQQSRLV